MSLESPNSSVVRLCFYGQDSSAPPRVRLQAGVTAKSRNELHSRKAVLINAVAEQEFARQERHTLHRFVFFVFCCFFLDDTKAKKKKKSPRFFFISKTIQLCYLLFLHSGMKSDKITDSTSNRRHSYI